MPDLSLGEDHRVGWVMLSPVTQHIQNNRGNHGPGFRMGLGKEDPA